MQIQHICGRTSCIDSGNELITIYQIDEKNIILIDSGLSNADKMIEVFDKNGLWVKAIVFTHLHIDHVLNNPAFYDRYKCDIIAYSTNIEEFIKRRNPQYPYRLFDLAPSINIEGVEIRIIHTPGHCPDHLALITPDNVCCLGDAVISYPLLNEFKLPYIEDVERAILTMEDIRHFDFPYFVISHKAVITKAELDMVVEKNIQKELDLYDVLRRQITAPTTMEDAVINFMLSIGISSERIQQLPYMKETVKPRVRTLAESGECIIQGDKIFPASLK